jgi:predicted PurR-regulated permease PerM
MNLLSFALYFAIAGFTLYLMIIGKALILPFVVAIVFWYLISTLAKTYARLGTWGYTVPPWLAMTFAVLTFVAVLSALVDLTSDNIGQVVKAAPTYQTNVERLLQQAVTYLGLGELPTVDQLRKQINLGSVAGELASGVASFLGNVGIILVYVIFLLIEQSGFSAKVDAVVGNDEARRARVKHIIERINTDIRMYLWVKTLLSIATAGISYLVMLAVGVDYAEFWAVLIFLLNYIPTIGSILGIVFPLLQTLVQFDEPLTPFIIVAVSLGATQIITGNVVEPKMMGKSLSLSPLVILISLAVWGSIWGVIGMFLSVPITVIAMIVFAQFRATRPIAIILSSDGNVSHLENEESVQATTPV